jgi:signal transduction histidine kinase
METPAIVRYTIDDLSAGDEERLMAALSSATGPVEWLRDDQDPEVAFLAAATEREGIPAVVVCIAVGEVSIAQETSLLARGVRGFLNAQWPEDVVAARAGAIVAAERRRQAEVDHRAQRLASRVVHDFNNPLAIISGNAQYLAEIIKATELTGEVADVVGDIIEAADRLAGQLAELKKLDRLPES